MTTPVKKWFKAKKYGYGWTPETFEGWVTLIIYCVLMTLVTIIFTQRIGDPLFNPLVSIGIYLFLLGILSIGFIVVCFLTGEKPSWNWGNKKKN